VITADTLTGSSVGGATLNDANQIGQLGAFTITGAGGELTIKNAQPLFITGPVSAEYIGITASGLIDLTGYITTTGLPLSTQLPSTSVVNPGTYFAVTGTSPTINQSGTLYLQPSAGAGGATVRFDLPSNGGTVTLNNLVGPQASLILYLRIGGTANGTLDVSQLSVVGQVGSTSLYGFVGSQTGPNAARLATITPNPATTYRINACPITSINCLLFPIGGTFLGTNPLRDYQFDTGSNNTDDELALPDVSSTDY